MERLCTPRTVLPTLSALAGLLCLAALPVQAQFIYRTNQDDTITITGYTGTNTTVDIPSTITGLRVISIGFGAFDSCTNLFTVTIPDSVAYIESAAFMWCTDLTRVTVGNSVTNIGVEAFLNCIRLASVAIPDSVIAIGNAAFQNCHSLTNVTLGSVTTISGTTFAGCSSLANITIPTTVTTIEAEAFVSCDHLRSITIPDTVTSIAYDAFNHCASLTNVSLGRSLTDLGWGAFGACSNLPGITIPSTLTSIQITTFVDCTSLTNVTIGTGVTNIEYNAFAGCIHLRGLFFLGNAPSAASPIFDNPPTAVVYYLPRTAGWGPTFSGCPTVLWDPEIQARYPTFGVHSNHFGFTITGTANIPIVVEASTDLYARTYSPLQTCTLTNGSIHFIDPARPNHPARFYRVRSP